MLQRFLREEEGANHTEYAVIAAGLVIVIGGGVTALGEALRATFIAWSASM